jgi:site-specific DNA-methyltransferase (adenine-specific)
MVRKEIIGDATLYLGDCLEILPTLPKVDAVITDPPYGVNLGEHKGAAEKRAGLLVKGSYASYHDTPENFVAIVVPAITKALALADRGLVFCSERGAWKLPAPDAIGGVYMPAACGRNAWGYQSLAHALLYGVAPDLHKGAKATAIRSSESAEKSDHPCPKPTGWMEWAVNLASRPCDVVLDPFMGSGTTGVAAVNLGRKFIGCEIDTAYFDIACRRIEQAYKQRPLFAAEPERKPEQLGLMA